MRKAYLSMIPIAYGACQTVKQRRCWKKLKRQRWGFNVTFYEVIISLCYSVDGLWMPSIFNNAHQYWIMVFFSFWAVKLLLLNYVSTSSKKKKQPACPHLQPWYAPVKRQMTNWCVAEVTDVYQQWNTGEQKRCWVVFRWTEVPLNKAAQPQMQRVPVQINIFPLTPPVMIACFCVCVHLVCINQCKKKARLVSGTCKGIFLLHFVQIKLKPSCELGKKRRRRYDKHLSGRFVWMN